VAVEEAEDLVVLEGALQAVVVPAAAGDNNLWNKLLLSKADPVFFSWSTQLLF
jgi:hypothetical protein